MIKLFLILLSLATAILAHSSDIYKIGDGSNTLLVIGGIHGNEPGAYFASSVLAQHYKIKEGSVWVLPNTNKNSIMRFKRGLNGDMNRKFNKINKNDKDYKVVTKIKQLIKSKNVNLVLNLHDGHGYYRHRWKNHLFNQKAWGQSLIIDQEKIDKNIKFNELKNIALKISKQINKNLNKNHHVFYVKNTKTKQKNKQMRLSLTFFAIKNNKPAFAVETSKNITDLTLKVQYQLKAIEEFMKIMNIKFSRDFDLNNYKNIKDIINNYQIVTINKNIQLELNGIKKKINYMPLKRKGNQFSFSHPLGGVIKIKNRYNLYIGNKKITTLQPQIFNIKQNNKNIVIIADGKSMNVEIGSSINIKKSFMVKTKNRVNVIGFKDKNRINESGLLIYKKRLIKKYSIDKKGLKYRIELYEKRKFLGMIVVNFI
jgi:hypothetical protein